MAPYFDHMHQKSTHERRTHAMRVAGVVTALIFAGWATTLGLSAGSNQSQVANSGDTSAQTAAAAVAGSGTAQLMVATTTTN